MPTTNDKISDVQKFLNSKGITTQPVQVQSGGHILIGGEQMVKPFSLKPKITYEYDVIVDSDHEKVGKAFVDENNRITFYLHDGWLIKSLRSKQITELLAQDIREFDVAHGASVGFDPMNQRTCVWYSPGADHVRDFGAELSSKYEFDRAQGLGSCSNSEVIKDTGVPNPSCAAEARMAACPFYEKEEWTVERKAILELEDENLTPNKYETSIVVETVRTGFGFRKFRVIEQKSNKTIVLDEISSVQHKADIYNVLDELFAKRIQQYNPCAVELIDVSVDESSPQEKYVDYVLAK